MLKATVKCNVYFNFAFCSDAGHTGTIGSTIVHPKNDK